MLLQAVPVVCHCLANRRRALPDGGCVELTLLWCVWPPCIRAGRVTAELRAPATPGAPEHQPWPQQPVQTTRPHPSLPTQQQRRSTEAAGASTYSAGMAGISIISSSSMQTESAAAACKQASRTAPLVLLLTRRVPPCWVAAAVSRSSRCVCCPLGGCAAWAGAAAGQGTQQQQAATAAGTAAAAARLAVWGHRMQRLLLWRARCRRASWLQTLASLDLAQQQQQPLQVPVEG